MLAQLTVVKQDYTSDRRREHKTQLHKSIRALKDALYNPRYIHIFNRPIESLKVHYRAELERSNCSRSCHIIGKEFIYVNVSEV